MEANPPPNVNWQKDGGDVTVDDERISQMENGSLNIASSQLTDSGTWTVIAENGLGQVERKQIELNVHPSRMPITVTLVCSFSTGFVGSFQSGLFFFFVGDRGI